MCENSYINESTKKCKIKHNFNMKKIRIYNKKLHTAMEITLNLFLVLYSMHKYLDVMIM